MAEEEEYIAKTAKTVEEAIDLIRHGYEYVTTINNIHLYRKRK